jgi:hypothetical protein
MDPSNYETIVAFLLSAGQSKRAWPPELTNVGEPKIPKNMLKGMQANYRRLMQRFRYEDSVLYRVQIRRGQRVSSGPMRRVVKKGEEVDILGRAHQAEAGIHAPRDTIMLDIKGTYWWKGMKKAVSAWIETCDECQAYAPSYWQVPLWPILTG